MSVFTFDNPHLWSPPKDRALPPYSVVIYGNRLAGIRNRIGVECLSIPESRTSVVQTFPEVAEVICNRWNHANQAE